MEKKIVFDKAPTKENARNSEGSFIRLDNGRILFAYSSFKDNGGDNAPSDIFCIYSDDDGDTWHDLGYIAKASDFGLTNIMSVSSMRLKDGSYAFFFIIKEGTDWQSESMTGIGKAVTKDGEHFTVSRCGLGDIPVSWFVINNSRLIRLSDGRIATAMVRGGITMQEVDGEKQLVRHKELTEIIVSDDEGETFHLANKEPIGLPEHLNINGVQQEEPGLFELEPGKYMLWARSNIGCQLVAYSEGDFDHFCYAPSEFVSPQSPMNLLEDEGVIYAVYNPNPCPLFPYGPEFIFGRTQAVIKKSLDHGKTFSEPVYFETDLDRGFCYFAPFATKDSLLIGYCAGSNDDGYCLNRLRIMKIKKSSI